MRLKSPTSQPTGFDYLERSVKMEFGSLTDQQPIGRHAVHPWMVDVLLPNAFANWKSEVVALEIERSFWEKATILHVEYHRPRKMIKLCWMLLLAPNQPKKRLFTALTVKTCDIE